MKGPLPSRSEERGDHGKVQNALKEVTASKGKGRRVRSRKKAKKSPDIRAPAG